MEDKYINLDGFLEGNHEAPLVWAQLKLKSDLTDKEWLSIEYFKIRAREFLLNIEDLKLPNMYSLSIDTGQAKASAKSNIYPNRHRAKSIYLDFRHFTANDEPSKFELVINTLKRYIEKEHILHKYLNDLKDSFLKQKNYAVKVSGKNIAAADIIDIWFNTEFFHAGENYQKEERIKLLEALDHEGNQHILFWSIINTQHAIKSLYACVKDLKNDNIVINFPDTSII